MKSLIHSKYFNLDLVKGVLLGIGYDDQDLMLAIGPLILTIKLWMIRHKKPVKSKYDVEI